MKFATPIIMLTAMSGAYSMIIKRDTPVKNVITNLAAAFDKLDTTVKAFDGNIQPVVDAADNIISLIASGQITANDAALIGLADTVTLLDSFKELDQSSKTLFNDVKGRVAEVEKAKQCDVTREKLDTINASSKELIGTILRKITVVYAKAQAQPYINHIESTLAQTQDLFAENNCVNAN
ncbi:hypothetical protein EMPS_07829 [Entomortierella parvispora]|uniref:Uncharacterized protein n=1 Tax=Entomortierella parvispora TaxID=205924 RepID=A0A9P3HEV3_9FUNG|nr:hypothetical protein EMPS_07829 [Entomortierella parvispora]